MLGRKEYTREELDHARTSIKQQQTAYQELLKALDAATDNPKVSAALEAFEPLMFNNMTLVLDRYFVHRLRMTAGKDGTPVNEVELVAESLINNEGELRVNSVIKYKPEESILKLEPGDKIRMSAGEFEDLAKAFLGEIDSKFVK